MVQKTADVAEIYAGEYISPANAAVTFGNPEIGFQLVHILTQHENEKNEIIGPKLSKLSENQPFGLIINIRIQKEIEKLSITLKDLEGVIEKKMGDFINQISGITHQQTRDKIEIRVSKKAVSNGLTFEEIQEDLKEMIMEQFPFSEDVFIQIITDKKTVEKEHQKALEIYKDRDERTFSLHDENVSDFYGCRICQISCPNHICVITPDHPSVCGTINWHEAGASCLSNPDGQIFKIEKGNLIDASGGEYTGVNEAVNLESKGETEKVNLYALIDHPHTTGASFDIIAFYIPELEGIGLIDRETEIQSVNGVSFKEMADYTGYGQQISGFSGVGETYLFSDKFLQKEGGWSRIVWISENLKNRLLQKLKNQTANAKNKKMAEMMTAVPTEREAGNIKELEQFFKKQ